MAFLPPDRNAIVLYLRRRSWPLWKGYSHIQQEFAPRLGWDWDKTMQRHAKPHSATAQNKPSHVLQRTGRWGKVASCNKEGNEVSIMLANNLPG